MKIILSESDLAHVFSMELLLLLLLMAEAAEHNIIFGV
jgi:hypothetical protein